MSDDGQRVDAVQLIARVRGAAGPDMIPSRLAAEEEARKVLEEADGRMTVEQAYELAQLLNRGSWGGSLKHNRFAPAFSTLHMDQMTADLGSFNDLTHTLWRGSAESALEAADRIIRDRLVLPGAGRSYATAILYLRDPDRFPIWFNSLDRGLAAITNYDERDRSEGSAGYLTYADAANAFASDYGLAPQETDAVLAEAARESVKQKAALRTQGDLTTIAQDPIEFLRLAYESRRALDEVDEIIEARDEVVSHYGSIFSPANLADLTAEEFKSFLLYENNRHWRGIQRHQAAITSDMDHLRSVLGLLLDESLPIEGRLDQIVRPDKANLVRGLGKAVFTPILLVVYPDKYGVWNSVAESAMKKLGLWPRFVRGASFGQKYRQLNDVVLDVASKVGVDLWILDTLWWAAEQTPDLTATDAVPGSDSWVPVQTPAEAPPVEQMFSLERHLHDFLRDNWDRTELGSEWELLTEGGDLVGYEYPTGVGRIDLLAHHRSDKRWLVIELKRGQTSDSTVGQVARYVGWIRENLAGEDDVVEGLVIAYRGDDKIRYALSVVPGIDFSTYEVNFRLQPRGG